MKFKTKTFNLIRIIAAIQVFWGHANVHLQTHYSHPVLGALEGVPIFFVLSGFLIWGSLERDSNLREYSKKRILRLFPVVWIGVILSIISIVLLYYKNIDWIKLGMFAVTQGTFMQFWTPEFLRAYGCGTPNGSLWTISVFVQFYILVYIFYKLTAKRKGVGLPIVIMLLSILVNCTIHLLKGAVPEVIYKLAGQTIMPYLWMFMLGIIIYKKREKIIPFMMNYWYIALVLLVLITLFPQYDIRGKYNVIKTFTQAFAIIGFSYKFPDIYVKKDISFEVYVLHMIVINIFINFGLTGSVLYVIEVLAITVVVAYLLNFFVNKYILPKFKKKKIQPSEVEK